MRRHEIVLFIFFTLHVFLHFGFDYDLYLSFNIAVFMSLLAVIPLLYFGFTTRSLPYALLILSSFTIFVSTLFYYKLHLLFVFLPLLYLLCWKSIRQKIQIILIVFKESIWMLVSIAALYYFFGALGYIIFYHNKTYFGSERDASLTFLQTSTLDQVGKITKLNYIDHGFNVSFWLIVVSIVLIHTLININMAFVLFYMSELVEGKAQHTLTSLGNVVGQHISASRRFLRILSRFSAIAAIFMPFLYQLRAVYLLASLISTALIILEDIIDKQIRYRIQVANILLQIAVLVTFFWKFNLINYLLCVARIFLIPEIKLLFEKVKDSISTLSTLFCFSFLCFLIFSVFMHLFDNSQQQNRQHKDIFYYFIDSLQLLVLDEWIKVLRIHSWYVAVTLVLYIVFVNHVLMNMLVAEVFNNIEISFELDEESFQGKTYSKTQVLESPRTRSRKVESSDNSSEVQRFLQIIEQIGYMKQ